MTAEEQPFVVLAPVELDLNSAVPMRREISAFLSAGAPSIVVDMSRCEFVDSTGTGALLGAQRETEKLGCRFVLRRPTARVLGTLDHMGVRGVFSIEI